GLDFVQGTIADYDSTGLDMLIALHACDTATDEALFKGISGLAELIVVAPCCHKQIRRQMEAGKPDKHLDFLLKHGTFFERQAEMVTDALRVMLLEYSGYATKAFEFISDAHTPKNVMIIAQKRAENDQKEAILNAFSARKTHFGIKTHALEKMLGLS
ncbi:MAG: methyltransferase, partial [Alphaproteobacteria bacterium]|nr:methyltransferase [Alphaproteobacteria bacterium]